MSRSRVLAASAFVLATLSFVCAPAQAQAPAQGARAGGARGQGAGREGGPARRPSLILKEEWAQNAKGDEHPISQESVGNPNLELKLYGTTSKEVAVTGKAGDENNPIHVWTGLTTSPTAVAVRDKANMADLTGLARMRVNTKVSGFHEIRPMVKLADGNYYVADKAVVGSTRDWLVSDISFADLHWLKLDPMNVVTKGNVVDKIDLSKVDEVGFADLMPGSGHGPGGWVDVAQFEVYGKAVPRGGTN
jgi:hypothetical protein